MQAAAVIAVAVSVLAVACAKGDENSACAPLVHEIAVSVGPADDIDPSPAGRLVELWSVGGAHEGQELVYPAAVSASRNGTVAIVDYQLAEVGIAGPDGNWLGRWGRKGRGPGELVMPVAAAWSGNRLAVYDMELGKVVFYRDSAVAAPDLSVHRAFAAPVVASGEVTYVGVRADGGVLLRYPPKRSHNQASDTALIALLLLKPGRAVPDTVIAATVDLTEQQPGHAVPMTGTTVPRAASGSDGWLALAAADGSYRIVIWDSTDAPVRQVCRPVPALPVTVEERGNGSAEQAAVLGAVGRMVIGSNGELWVDRRRRTELHGAKGGELDVFDSAGQYRGTVEVPPGVSIQAISRDRAWGVRFGDNDEPWIVGYRVER